MQAIALIPNREEGYFLMSRFHERNAEWRECYTWAELGLYHSTDTANPFLEYPGEYALKFEKAVAGWWVGRTKDSVEISNSLLKQELNDDYRASIVNNLSRIVGLRANLYRIC